ncbi:MAG: hypothetical protein AAF961_10995, partial [Planctomycetota bacterium]
YDLTDLVDRLVVCVVPIEVQISRATRASDWHDVPVEIGLMYKPDPVRLGKVQSIDGPPATLSIDAEADRHVALVQEVCDYFRSRTGRILRGAGPEGQTTQVRTARTTTLLLREHLEEFRQLSSVVRVTCRTLR